MQKTAKHINNLLIVFFLILLITPTIISVFGIEGKELNTENRNKTNFPNIKTLKNPKQYVSILKDYYNDNFGLRQSLSNYYINFKSNRLNESPLPNKVIIGKNGFYFLGNSFSNVVNESLGFNLFTKKELTVIKNTVLDRKKWLNDKGMKFYLAVTPNKHSVYRTNLPFNFSPKETRKQQIITHLSKDNTINFIDLGEQFIHKKGNHLLYRKLDSHWNNIGAFYGYQTLIDAVKKDFSIEKKQLSEYKISTNLQGGDLKKMLNLSIKDTLPILNPLNNYRIDTLNIPKFYKNKRIQNVVRFKNESKKYKVLLFRDSYTNAMIPYINQSFGTCIYVWSHRFDKEIILKEKPDIVIMEYVERYLEQIKE